MADRERTRSKDKQRKDKERERLSHKRASSPTDSLFFALLHDSFSSTPCTSPCSTVSTAALHASGDSSPEKDSGELGADSCAEDLAQKKPCSGTPSYRTPCCSTPSETEDLDESASPLTSTPQRYPEMFRTMHELTTGSDDLLQHDVQGEVADEASDSCAEPTADAPLPLVQDQEATSTSHRGLPVQP